MSRAIPSSKEQYNMPERHLETPNRILKPETEETVDVSPRNTIEVGAERRSFYSRGPDPRGSRFSDVGNLRMSFGESTDDREYFFPTQDLKERISVPVSQNQESEPSSLKSHIKAHSISVTNPVCRSMYESLPQSPAASYLANFAFPNEWNNKEMIEDGSVIRNYRLGPVIGRGSFSECREASSLSSSAETVSLQPNDKLAMKIVRNDHQNGGNLLDFDHEISIWSQMRHKNILPLLDVVRLDHARIAVSPIAEKGNLLDFITQNGPLSENQAACLFKQVAEAVGHMHCDKGIVHRDIKLENILLDAGLRPYVCDFGLSECLDGAGEISQLPGSHPSMTTESQSSKSRSEEDIFCKGSLWYLPPEELDDALKDKSRKESPCNTEYRKKGDIWALGVVLYAMVTGKLPFSDDFIPRLQVSICTGNYPPLPASISTDLRDLISKLLTVDYQKRPDIRAILSHRWLNI